MPDSPALSRLGGKRVSFRPIFLIIFIFFLSADASSSLSGRESARTTDGESAYRHSLNEQSDVFPRRRSKVRHCRIRRKERIIVVVKPETLAFCFILGTTWREKDTLRASSRRKGREQSSPVPEGRIARGELLSEKRPSPF